MSSYVYGYDSDGHKTSAVESDTGVGTTAYSYQYNAIGELTKESASGARENYTYWYGYDAAGNQMYKSSDNPTSTAFMDYDGNTTINFYNADNELTASFNDAVKVTAIATPVSGMPSPTYVETYYSYDNNGSVIDSDSTSDLYVLTYNGFDYFYVEDGGPEVNTTFGYDVRNRMTSMSSANNGSTTATANYSYNDAGERVSENNSGTTTTYLYDTQNPTGYDQIIEERNSGGTAQDTFIIGLDNIAQMSSGGTLLYLLKDGHGYTRVITSSSGSVTQSMDFDAYGVAERG